MADVAEERRVLYVEVRGEENDGLQLEVGPDGLLVGRSNTCDVIFQNREVSRRHAYFYRDEDHCHVEDLGSKNGLLVNGRRVSKTTLRDGDVVDIGPSRFHIHSDDSDSGVAVAAGALPDPVAEDPPTAHGGIALRHPLAVSSFVFAVLAYVHWGFGLGAVVLALLSLWETRQDAVSAGRGLAWGGLALGVIGGLLNGWFTVAAPHLQDAQVAAARRECGQNLRDIGVALTRYQTAHDGRYPAHLADLIADKLLDPQQILCPGCLMRRRGACEYAYLPPGPAAEADGREIVAWDNSPENHADGGWVLTRNGLALWMEGSSFTLLTPQLQEQPAAPPAGARGGSEP